MPPRLAFTVEPGLSAAGIAISPAIQVTVQDERGDAVTGSSAVITLAITDGTGTPGAVLGGSLTRTATGGVATFDDLVIDKVGSGYTLSATATSVTGATSAAFTVEPGPASRLAFTVQPSALAAGASMSPAVQVTVQDALGNTVTGSSTSITLAISDGTGTAGAVLGGSLTRPASGGVAGFDDLTIDKVGSAYTLDASAVGLTGVTSAGFAVDPGPPSRLAFAVQPGNAWAGGTISPGVQVAVQDAFGNQVTGSTMTITLGITAGTGTPGAVLGGALARPAVAGVAGFGDLAIDQGGNGYTLDATAVGLAGATSADFRVVALPQGKLAFLSDHDGTLQVYLVNADGSGVQQLTNGVDWGISGSFFSNLDQLVASRDGSHLALAGPGIHIINTSDGSDFMTVSPNGFFPAWAPTDSAIRYIVVDSILNVHPDGTGTTLIGPINLPGERIAWSPDLDRAAFQWQINFFTSAFVANADGSDLRPLDPTEFAGGAPAWSPDGTRIAWWNGGLGIVMRNSDGSGPLTVLAAEPFNGPRQVEIHTDLSWSPDGSYLAFTGYDAAGVREIWIVEVSGPIPPIRVSPAGYSSWAPTWLPGSP